jgi:hypothetical protein
MRPSAEEQDSEKSGSPHPTHALAFAVSADSNFTASPSKSFAWHRRRGLCFDRPGSKQQRKNQSLQNSHDHPP